MYYSSLKSHLPETCPSSHRDTQSCLFPSDDMVLSRHSRCTNSRCTSACSAGTWHTDRCPPHTHYPLPYNCPTLLHCHPHDHSRDCNARPDTDHDASWLKWPVAVTRIRSWKGFYFGSFVLQEKIESVIQLQVTIADLLLLRIIKTVVIRATRTISDSITGRRTL